MGSLEPKGREAAHAQEREEQEPVKESQAVAG